MGTLGKGKKLGRKGPIDPGPSRQKERERGKKAVEAAKKAGKLQPVRDGKTGRFVKK